MMNVHILYVCTHIFCDNGTLSLTFYAWMVLYIALLVVVVVVVVVLASLQCNFHSRQSQRSDWLTLSGSILFHYAINYYSVAQEDFFRFAINGIAPRTGSTFAKWLCILTSNVHVIQHSDLITMCSCVCVLYMEHTYFSLPHSVYIFYFYMSLDLFVVPSVSLLQYLLRVGSFPICYTLIALVVC